MTEFIMGLIAGVMVGAVGMFILVLKLERLEEERRKEKEKGK